MNRTSVIAATRLLAVGVLGSAAPSGCSSSHAATDADGTSDAAMDAGVGPTDATAADVDGGNARDASDGGTPDSIADEFYAFCVRRWTLFCEGNQRCCRWLTRPRVLDAEECTESRIVDRCSRTVEAEEALHDGTLRWNAEAAAAHLAALEEHLPDCSRGPGITDLRDLLIGTLGLGGDCTPAEVYRFPAGFRCEAGLRCELEGTEADYTGTCAPLGQSGDSCTYHVECADGLYCEWDAASAPEPYAGRCEPIVPVGSACPGGDHMCSSGFCDLRDRLCIEPEPSDSWCLTFG